MSIVSIRGAITIEHNEKEAILAGTKEMLQAILTENNITQDEIIQIHFSSTRDLDAVYPAVAARELNIVQASLMCFQEMYVEGSLKKCIRVGMLIEKEGLTKQNVKHQYLKGASVLRPDLIK